MGGINKSNQITELHYLKEQIEWFDNLLEFIYKLRALGFRASLPQVAAAQQLLVTLAATGRIEDDFRNLKSYLAPLFCFSADDQQRFYHLFDEWLENQPLPSAQTVKTPAIAEPEIIKNQVQTPVDLPPKKEPKKKAAWWRSQNVIAVISLLIFLGAAALIGIFLAPSQKNFTVFGIVRDENSQQTISGAKINFENQTRESDADGKFAFDYQSKAGQSHELLVSRADYESLRVIFETDESSALLEIRLKRTKPPIQTDSPTPPPPPPTPAQQLSEYEIIYSWLLIFAAALPFLVFGLWLLWRILWRKYIERWRDRNKPDLRKIKVEQKDNKLYRQPEFLRVARELRRHRRIKSNVLEPALTIEATLRAGNFFTPVYGVRHLSPEYLVLIDRLSYTDQNAHLTDEIVNRLKKQGVFVDRFFFEGDPRASWREGKDNKFYDLSELAAQFPDHRLLIFSDGDEMIDRSTNRPQPWLDELLAWDIRLLLTTNAAHSFNEWLLNHFGLPVLRAQQKELKHLLEIINAGELPRKRKSAENGDGKTNYPPSLREGFDEWWMDSLDPDWKIRKRERTLKRLKRKLRWSRFFELFRKNQSEKLAGRIRRTQVTEFEKAEMLRIELRYYLGATGYELLCASAVYPEMLWDLTFYMAHRIVDAPKREAVLEALVCLPWFRYGKMPDWLRNRLLASLPPDREIQIRRELEQLLISYLQNPKRGFQLEIAPQKPSKGVLNKLSKRIKEWFRRKRFYELIKAERKDSPLRDYVFLNFFSGGRLSIALPRRLNRALLYGKDLTRNWLDKFFNLAKHFTIAFFNFIRRFYRRGNPLLGLSFSKALSIPLAAAIFGIFILFLPASIWLVAGFPDRVAENLPAVNLGIEPPFEIPTPSPTVTPMPSPSVPATPSPSVSPTPASPTPASPTPASPTPVSPTPTLTATRTPATVVVTPTVTVSVSPTPRTPVITPTPSTTIAAPIVTVTPTPLTPTPSTPTSLPKTPPERTCPRVSLTASQSSITQGESVRLNAKVDSGSPDDLTFSYTVSAGRIIGQGTPNVNWDLSGVRPGTYTATLAVDTQNSSCGTTTDTITIEVSHDTTEKSSIFDQYPTKSPSEEEQARLDNYFVALRNDPTATGYIIVSGSASEVNSKLKNIRNYINSRKFDASRITLVNGGASRNATIQLWIVPAGAAPPR
ncbi:MAG TPA: hypothetical protein VF721_12530 [Pyrinomonadaceae bacterium]